MAPVLSVQAYDDNNCPVPDEVLGRLYHSPQHNLVEIISTIPALQRARLAVFCYGRAHLNEMGRTIAAMCDRETLVEVADKLGAVVFATSREQLTAPTPRMPYRKITLAASASMGSSGDEIETEGVERELLDDGQAFD